MAIVYQAPDALLFTVNKTLMGDMWGDRVYSKVAPEWVQTEGDLWVVCRVPPSGGNNFYRGDRQSEEVFLRVQAVSEESKPSELAGARIHDLLHLGGVNDSRRPNTSIGTHTEWRFLSVEAIRPIRLVPSREIGTRWYETGYEFRVMMEAINGYS